MANCSTTSAEKVMIDIRQAVDAAIAHLNKLYGNVNSLQLEEVFLSDDETDWLVTLSFLAPVDEEEVIVGQYGMIARVQQAMLDKKKLVRKYKSFEVDGETGEVRSMKIRPVPSV
jgi:hypothetical protein